MTSLATRLPFNRKRSQPLLPLPRLQILWLMLAASLMSFILAFVLDGRAPALDYLFYMMSCVTCGLTWLFSRELFASKGQNAIWPYALVSVLFVATVTLSVSTSLGLERDGVLGVVGEIAKLISSTVLLLPFLEAIDGYGRVKRSSSSFAVGS